jgi:hypothetical protein
MTPISWGLVVKSQTTNLIPYFLFGHLILSSQFQMENGRPFSIYAFQDLSTGILGPNLDQVYYIQYCP